MSFAPQLEQYVAGFRERLTGLARARGAAILAAAALAMTVLAVLVAGRVGFPHGLMVAARIVLFATLGFLAWRFLLQARRALEIDAGAHIEARVPEFNGRVTTFMRARDDQNALLELLAEDTLAIAGRNAATQRVPPVEFRNAWSVAGASALLLLLLAVAGPGNFAYGVRDLWLGWALPGLLPPQSLAVTPGDSGIRLGGNLRIVALPQGFDPDAAEISVRFAGGDWQQLDMASAGEGFDFTFYAVRQDLEYFVAADSVRSPAYSVQVANPPVIESLGHHYEYPAWTGREPETVEPAGDIRKIADTRVEVRLRTDRELPAGDLVVNDTIIPLDVDGTRASAVFEVATDGQYYIAARVGGAQIRLSDDYFIRVEEDQPPEIEFARPGRDWSASRIEEVTARVAAKDDLRLEGLELRFSINGAEWQAVALDPTDTAEPIDHVFYLESLSTDQAPLEPGDLVTYYAVARDRESEARTDIFFIDVQPFDRRYSQSQAAGGQQGQQGQQNEISQRQREIIISTWNLVRERDGARHENDAYISDNAALLARLQATLREQVQTLAARAEARQLTDGSDNIQRFVSHLTAAGEAMLPAAERLADIEFENALLKEQEALQHLLAAEAVFSDINVSSQANNRGGGGQAGRDLAEMFELEMDLEKNQYETGSRATPDAPEQQLDEIADELEELARRQQQLARNQQNARTPQPEQRWQQEQLKRDVEELQRQLEELTQAQQGQQAANRSSSSQQSGQSGQGEADQQVADLQRRLQSALRAMGEANAGEAGSQLQGASDSANEAQRAALQARFNDLATRASQLHAAQVGVDERLQQAVRESVEAGPDDEQAPRPWLSGLELDEEADIAEQKRQILADLQNLQQSARSAAQTIAAAKPETADDIRDAIADLQEQRIEARIAIAAAYIEQGEAVYIASSESVVTESLRSLSRTLERAARDVAATDGAGETSDLARALANARALRQDLQENPAAAAEALETRVQDLAGAVADAVRTQQGQQRPGDNNVANLRRLSDELRIAGGGRDPGAIAENMVAIRSLVERLELELGRAMSGREEGIRTHLEEQVPESYREVVADYYRRLGQVSTETDSPAR